MQHSPQRKKASTLNNNRPQHAVYFWNNCNPAYCNRLSNLHYNESHIHRNARRGSRHLHRHILNIPRTNWMGVRSINRRRRDHRDYLDCNNHQHAGAFTALGNNDMGEENWAIQQLRHKKTAQKVVAILDLISSLHLCAQTA